MTDTPPFLTRIQIQSYKSIKACDVSPKSLAFLVGPNGSGKSNFLDALRFVADALNTTLDHALRDRGGIGQVRRRSGGHPNHFAIRLDFRIPDGPAGYYMFQVGAKPNGGFSVKLEECSVAGAGPEQTASFKTRDDAAEASTTLDVAVPAVGHDRLYLVALSGIEPFRSVYNALVRMCFYNLNPDAIRAPQAPDPGSLLRRDGSNLPGVLANLRKHSPATMQRIEDYLGHVVPGVRSATQVSLGALETLEFRQDVAGQKNPWKFPPANMSDGTLRTLGILTALLQDSAERPTLIAIEEPEMALHPAALGALLDAIHDAKERTQVFVTSHSPDLLHSPEVEVEELLAVSAEAGVTAIGEVDEASRKVLSQRLFTAGELLRLAQLEPDEAARSIQPRQLQFSDK